MCKFIELTNSLAYAKGCIGLNLSLFKRDLKCKFTEFTNSLAYAEGCIGLDLSLLQRNICKLVSLALIFVSIY